VPAGLRHNAHIYYILLSSLAERSAIINELRAQEITTVFHYVPLHSSPAGLRYGRVSETMAITDDLSDRLLRLPLWVGIDESVASHIADMVVSQSSNTSC
jgi:dTDP-4-amino-4,6-dideoxygalactose transaminase